MLIADGFGSAGRVRDSGASIALMRVSGLAQSTGAAARLRSTLSGSGTLSGQGVVRAGGVSGLWLADGTAENLRRAAAAVLLLRGPAAVLDTGWVLRGAPPVAAAAATGDGATPVLPVADAGEEGWYRALADLHHGHPALRAGRVTFFDRDAQDVLAWIVRPADGRGVPLLVVCNLSGQSLRVALGADLKALGVRRTYLKTLVRTDAPAVGATLDEIDLPGGGVLVGEVR